MKNYQTTEWDLVIRPQASFFNVDFNELWQYRDLLVLFVKRDFTAQYKQTVLGPVWHFIQPILTSIMFLLIFGKIANIPTDGIEPKIVFYMSGITIWNYFSTCINTTSNTFIANAGIFGKVYFPRLIIPLSIVVSNMVKFGIQFLLLLLIMIWFAIKGHSFHIGFNWLIIPFLVCIMGGIALGLGIMISALTTKYRDFGVLISFGVQLLMYATPIAYPLSFLISKNYRWIITMNPLTPVVEAFRYILFGHGTFTAGSLAYSMTFMLVSLFAGMLVFGKVERTFMDTV